MSVHGTRLTIIALTSFALSGMDCLHAQPSWHSLAADPWSAYARQLAEYHEKLREYHVQLAAWRARHAGPGFSPQSSSTPKALPLISLVHGQAACSRLVPVQVMYAVNAANHLQTSPYVLGAGHRRIEDFAYDCSSSASYVLIKAGLLDRTLTSQQFAEFGEPGVGRFITIWVKPGHHVFMTLCGLRLDTSGGTTAQGPRWRTQGRSHDGFLPRHPPGF
jgi:hypothetical protein